MPSRLKVNSVVLIMLAGLFVFAKYNLTRLRVPPFGLDPCDAVMHFAFFTMVLALIASLDAVRPHRKGVGYAAQDAYVARSQQAAALAVFSALLAHVVALARHPSMWVRADYRSQLLVWLGVFAAVPVTMELLVLAGQPIRTQVVSPHGNRAVLACLLALIALVFCPEYGTDLSSETAHILTVILGGLVVLVPIGYLLPVLVPYQSREKGGSKAFFNTSSERAAVLIGILMGAFLFWADAHRAGAARALLPALKSVGPVIGFLIAYAFLAEQLGLTPHNRVSQ
jgi:hypothetical protein